MVIFLKIIKEANLDNEFAFIAYMPEKLSKQPALIVQLHGAGERGDGNDDLDKVLVHGFSKIVNDDNLKDCILIMPQCPCDTFWVAKIESLKRFIDKAITRFNIDTDRVYLCGISMGGFGTWYTAMAYPDMFAAIAPCCGGGMAWNAGTLKMPVWAFHGLADDVVSPRHTIEMIESIEKRGGNARYSLYEGVGHNSWNKAFQNELLEWLLAQSK